VEQREQRVEAADDVSSLCGVSSSSSDASASATESDFLFTIASPVFSSSVPGISIGCTRSSMGGQESNGEEAAVDGSAGVVAGIARGCCMTELDIAIAGEVHSAIAWFLAVANAANQTLSKTRCVQSTASAAADTRWVLRVGCV
jgi:hypothetical protein